MPFINNILLEKIMKRTSKKRQDGWKQKKNIRYDEIIVFHFCAKRKKEYYRNLDEKKVNENLFLQG